MVSKHVERAPAAAVMIFTAPLPTLALLRRSSWAAARGRSRLLPAAAIPEGDEWDQEIEIMLAGKSALQKPAKGFGLSSGGALVEYDTTLEVSAPAALPHTGGPWAGPWELGEGGAWCWHRSWFPR